MSILEGWIASEEELIALITDADARVDEAKEALRLVSDRTMRCYVALLRRDRTMARGFMQLTLENLHEIVEDERAWLTRVALALDEDGKPKSATAEAASL